MAFPDVQSNQLNGRSGRPLTGFDHYSGMIFYGAAPSVTGKWKQYPGPPVINAQQMFAASDAASAGIIPYTDNTAASGSYQISTPGAAGDTLEITVTIPLKNGGTKTISLGGVYTVTTNTTATLQGADYAALINAQTVNHGFSAVNTTGTIAITAPKNLGKCLNSGTPIAINKTGSFAGTIVQFASGTASQYAIWEYHIRRFFLNFPKGVLHVGILAAPSSFNEISALQTAFGSKLRQVVIADNNAGRGAAGSISATITSIQNACKAIEQTAPLYAVYAPNLFGVTDLSAYPDQNLNTGENVQCVISQDGDGEGAAMFVINQQTVGHAGEKLATIAKKRVSGSDAAVTDDFNLAFDGVENNVIAFANGVQCASVSIGIQIQLDLYRYTFLRQFTDEVTGSYWVGNKSCVNNSSDYANSNDKQTIQKVQRLIRSALIKKLNSEVYYNTDGTLQDFSVEDIKNTADKSVRNNMITGFGSNPLISNIIVDFNPTQVIKQSGIAIVDASVDQNGVIRGFVVNIAYS